MGITSDRDIWAAESYDLELFHKSGLRSGLGQIPYVINRVSRI
jgi:hypothetical protein